MARRPASTRVSIDWTAEPSFIRERVQSKVAVQGNLDPLVLISGGDALNRAVDDVKANYAQGRFIFNLGHGIQPETPDRPCRADDQGACGAEACIVICEERSDEANPTSPRKSSGLPLRSQ